jgi:hypothetical protein
MNPKTEGTQESMKKEEERAMPGASSEPRGRFRMWDVGKVAEDLIEQRVTSDKQPQYLIQFILSCQTFLLVGARNIVFGTWEAAFAIVSIPIITLGVFLCYRANKKGDGRNFLERFICLGSVIGVRLCVFMAMLVGCATIFFGMVVPLPLDIYSSMCFQIFYLWRLFHWIGVVSKGSGITTTVGALARASISPQCERH